MYAFSPIEYLDSMLVDYSLIPHEESFTAETTAQSAHIKGKDLSKVIVVENKEQMSMIVIPANCNLVQNEISRLFNAPELSIVPEFLFQERFPECEPGAMPPFGNLYSMDVYIADELTQNRSMTFNGGSHTLLINMLTDDFLNITTTQVINQGYRTNHGVRFSDRDEKLQRTGK